MEEGIDSYQFVEYRPSSTLTEGSSFEFHIPGSGALYTDWSTSRLVLKVKIAQADGRSPPNPNTGAPVNLTLYSLFHQVDVLVRGKKLLPKWELIILTYISWVLFCFMEWASK